MTFLLPRFAGVSRLRNSLPTFLQPFLQPVSPRLSERPCLAFFGKRPHRALAIAAALGLSAATAPSWAQFEFKQRVPDLEVLARLAALNTPLVQASPSVLEFGNRLIGSTSVLDIQWLNTYEQPLVFGPVSISAPAGFALHDNECTTALPSGQSCVMRVRFIPSSLSRHTAVLNVSVAGKTYSVPLGGTGVADAAATVTWTLPEATYGQGEMALTPPATGLPGAWTFASADPSRVEIEGQLAVLKAAGVVTLTATQAASAGHPERSYSAMLSVKKAAPAVGEWSPVSVPVATSFTLEGPSSESEAPWSFEVANPQLARVENGVLRGLNQGTTTLMAVQAESANYAGVRLNTTLNVLPLADVELSLSQALSTRQGESRTVTATLTNRSALPMTLGNQAVGVSSKSGLFAATANNCRNTTVAPGGQCTVGIRLNGSSGFSGHPASPGVKHAHVWLNSGTQAAVLPIEGVVTARPSIKLPGGSSGRASESFSFQCHGRYSPQFGGPQQQYFCNGSAWMSILSQRSACDQCFKYVDQVQLSTSTLAFGANQVGSTSERGVQLINNESFAVAVNGVTLSGSTAYSATTNCATLQPGQGCTASVTFSPTAAGTLSARLHFVTSSEGSPYVVSLSGSAAYLEAQRGSLALTPKVFGDPAFPLNPPASNSPGAWSYSSSNPSVASVVGNLVTPLSAGTTTLTATQAASGPYASGSVSAVLVVGKAPAVLGTWEPLTFTYQGGPITLTPPDSNSNGAWSYAWVQESLGAVVGNQFTPGTAGSAILRATQADGSNHLGASRTTTITVQPGTPVLGAWSVPTAALSQGTVALSPPSSSSSGTWSYTSSNPAVASVSGNVLTLHSAGQTTLTATQASTALYTSAQTNTVFTVEAVSAQSCLALLQATPGLPSGVYNVQVDGTSRAVYCDMTTAGGGWTLIARYTDWSGPGNSARQMLVRGETLTGFSNSAATFPAYSGPNVFAEIRYDSGNSNWNSRFGTSASAGMKFPTRGSWVMPNSANDLLLGATRLDGSTSSALSTVAERSAAWWNQQNVSARAGSSSFGIFTTASNQGDCGGENRVGPIKMCPILSTIGTGANNHFDATSLKWIYGR